MATAPREFTLRGILLGAAMTLVFTAANIFLGLRVGLTFATSIPAAVISMAVLRLFRGSSILENNIVQTVASAAGAIGSIIFILPGLVMVGWWTSFPFWQSSLLCATGGLLGVAFSVPLRRTLVMGSDLPFPEGCAGAEVLKVGSVDGQLDGDIPDPRAGLSAILTGGAISVGYALATALRLTADAASAFTRIGGAVLGTEGVLSFALVGVGHLIGLAVGLAMLFGLVIGYGIGVPWITWAEGLGGTPAEAAAAAWSDRVRYIGAGAMGVAALWTLAGLIVPIARGLAAAMAASRSRRGGAVLPVEERDLPVAVIGALAAVLIVPIAWLLFDFLRGGPLASHAVSLTIGGTLFVVIAGAFVSAVCGYMAGLVGSSNSPLSGVGILALLGGATLLAVALPPIAGAQRQLVAFALFATSITFAAAVIANDNLQDLKTGQLVGATPWKQQVALMIGVVAGSIAVPLVLTLLDRAYGFGTPTAAHPAPLPAPQAMLLSALARGVLGGALDWRMIGIGGAIAVGLILLDTMLGRRGAMRLPPLAVGMGIYLPMAATLPVVIGAIVGHLWERRHPAARHMGVLVASGLIVGDSLFGVALAALIVATGSAAPLAIMPEGWAAWAMPFGFAAFVALAIFGYARAASLGQVARKG